MGLKHTSCQDWNLYVSVPYSLFPGRGEVIKYHATANCGSVPATGPTPGMQAPGGFFEGCCSLGQLGVHPWYQE
jgi:hypothetical protein